MKGMRRKRGGAAAHEPVGSQGKILWATKVLCPERAGAMRRDDARNLLRRTLAAFTAKHEITMFAWSVEPSRIHLVLAIPPGPPIEDLLGELFAHYTRRFNARYRRRGAVFRTKFLHRIPLGVLGVTDAIRRVHLAPGEDDRRLPGQEPWSSREVYEGGRHDGVVTLYEPPGGAIRRTGDGAALTGERTGTAGPDGLRLDS